MYATPTVEGEKVTRTLTKQFVPMALSCPPVITTVQSEAVAQDSVPQERLDIQESGHHSDSSGQSTGGIRPTQVCLRSDSGVAHDQEDKRDSSGTT